MTRRGCGASWRPWGWRHERPAARPARRRRRAGRGPRGPDARRASSSRPARRRSPGSPSRPRPRRPQIPASDVEVLNYALVLEYLQAAFYTEAERSKALRGKTAEAARVVGATERAHVKAFRDLLGKKAVGKPHFDFQGVTEKQAAFLKTAVAFEDLAVAAYKGQAGASEVERGADIRARDPYGRGAPCRLDALPQRQRPGRRRVRPAAQSQRDQRHRPLDGVHRREAEDVQPPHAALLGVARRRWVGLMSRRAVIAAGLAAGAAGGLAVIAVAESGEPSRARDPAAARAARRAAGVGARDPAAERRSAAAGTLTRWAYLRRAIGRPVAAGARRGARRAARAADAGGHAHRAARRRPPRGPRAARCGCA